MLGGLVVVAGRISVDDGLRNRSWLFRCEANVAYFPSGEQKRSARLAPSVGTDPLYTCDDDRAQKHIKEESQRIKTENPDAELVPRAPFAVSNNKVLFWYFLFHVVLFESFWVRRLRQIVEFRVQVVG